jgi:hypothetical protein
VTLEKVTSARSGDPDLARISGQDLFEIDLARDRDADLGVVREPTAHALPEGRGLILACDDRDRESLREIRIWGDLERRCWLCLGTCVARVRNQQQERAR